MSDWLDDDVLAEQYADSSNLVARQILHVRFSTADHSLHEWLFDQFDLQDTEQATVLSLGGEMDCFGQRTQTGFQTPGTLR